jgi:dipeptidyl aminopeptidase/acylaminoacyl peptidase
MINLETLLRVPHVDSAYGYDLSPDGTTAAFAWNPDGQWEIYEIPLDGSLPAKQISSGPGGKFGPRYSPDGSCLAYLVDFDGGENYHLFLHDLVSGEARDLAPEITYALEPPVSWGPDGKQVALLADQSGNFSPYVRSLDGGEPRRLFDVGHPAWQVRWSPAGTWVAATVLRSGQDHTIYLASPSGGNPQPLKLGNAVLNSRTPAWAPDGSRLAFSSGGQEYAEIGILEISTGEITWLTEGEREKDFPTWSPDGQWLAYTCSRGANVWVAVQKPGGMPIRYQVGPGVHYHPRFSRDGQHLVAIFESPAHPADLWVLPLNGDQPVQLTHSLPAELEQADFPMPEEIHYPGLDGQPVPALMFQPTDREEPGPAVIVPHGGPNWLFQAIWYPIMCHMASRGWTVLAPNYRGSTGYGRSWQMANRFDLGGIDAKDLAAGAEYLAREGLADPSRIAITGRSHGGYLTMVCLTQYPELWAAGSAIVPFLNWFTSHANSRQDLQHWDRENFGDPIKDYQLWYERSPFFYLNRVRCPVQLIGGANDPRCPASESVAARDRLLELGKEVDFHLYPDEGHTFLKTRNLIDSELKRVEFLARVLD